MALNPQKTNHPKQTPFDIILPLAGLLLLSLLFILTDLDLIFHANFHTATEGWFLKDVQPWRFIYHYGNIPALALTIGALLVLALSPYLKKLRKLTKRALYLILVMAIAPGLLINVILKDNWGRPRPRNISDFGGKHQFEKVLIVDPDSPGKSFPCGHCSMGFYLFALYFLFRKKRQKLASLIFIITLVWGSLIGLARIVQGGHFLSDVIWSAGLVYLTAFLLYRFMGMESKPAFSQPGTNKGRSRLVAIISSILIFVAIILVSLATPYSRDKFYEPKEKIDLIQNRLEAEFQMLNSDIILKTGEDLKLKFQAEGFGFPKSKIINKMRSARSDSIYNLTYKQRLKGFFSELQQANTIYLPSDLQGELLINSPDADLTIQLEQNSNWLIVPAEVGKIIDPGDYLNKSEQVVQKHDRVLTIKLTLTSGTLRIVEKNPDI